MSFYDLSDVVRFFFIFSFLWLSHEDAKNQAKIKGICGQDSKPVKASDN